MASEARNSIGDRAIIMATTPTKVMALEISCTTDCSRAICTLSASLVKRLISSPWVWASKKLRGSCWSLSNSSLRSLLQPFWASWAMRLDWI